jgi:hypothetical protein
MPTELSDENSLCGFFITIAILIVLFDEYELFHMNVEKKHIKL